MIKLRTLLLYDYLYIIILIISAVYSFIYINYIDRKSIYKGNESEFNLIVDSYKIIDNKITFNLYGKEALIGNFYIKEGYLNFNIGDTLKIKGELLKPNNNTIPNTFNYKKYLYNKDIFYIINIDDYKVIKENENIFYKIKNFFYKRVEKYDKEGYLYAFIIGEKSYIDKEIYKSYSNNGITHLFALSGLHVSTFSLIIFTILKIFKIKELGRYIITFIILLLLCFITGFSPSILRASLLFFLIGINNIYYFYVKSENILILLFSIFLFINPYYIFNLSFELSFTITYFILINVKNIKGNYIITMLKVSIISFLGSLPIIINNFYSVNMLSIINNLFFIPYVTFIIYPLSLLVLLFPSLYSIYSFLIYIMEIISSTLCSIKVFNISIPKIPGILCIFYYIFLIIYYKKRKHNYIYIILLIIIINFLLPTFDKNSYVYFLDVGQGDSTLIITENSKSILIDTGGNTSFYHSDYSLMKSSLIPFYKSIGLNKIDYLFLSHGDDDHAGYSSDLINNFNVQKICINKGNINALEKNIENKTIFKENYIKIDNVEIYSLNNDTYDNENDNSQVLLVKIGDYSILFMGDASKEVEKNIIKKYNLEDIDILKVGHHGSRTSTSEELINKINPKYSLISVKKNNIYNHPNKEVINILNKYDSKILYTSIDGTVRFKIKDKSLYLKTFSP